jgi:hypothetical protein
MTSSRSRSDAIADYFQEYPPEAAELAVSLRRVVQDALPDAREELDRSGHVVGYNFGSGYAGLMATIIMSQSGVKLGLVGSADLPDPARLLEGTGKRHRYISFKKPADFHRAGIRDLLLAARARWQAQSRKKG